jgi:hypothetical protein
LERALASRFGGEAIGEGKEARVGLQHARNAGPSAAVLGRSQGRKRAESLGSVLDRSELEEVRVRGKEGAECSYSWGVAGTLPGHGICITVMECGERGQKERDKARSRGCVSSFRKSHRGLGQEGTFGGGL